MPKYLPEKMADELSPGVNESGLYYIAQKRKISVFVVNKMAEKNRISA